MGKKKVLTLEENYDFLLAGISSHLKDYRLCYEINKGLNFRLRRGDDLEIWKAGKKSAVSFSFYTFDDAEGHVSYHVVNNKSDQGHLVPEARQVDFFLLIKGHMPDKDFVTLIQALRKMPNVLTAFAMNPNDLKSASNLLI